MDKERRLVRHGFVLFLLGLLTGFAVYRLTNPRMGVTAHLEGVTNGMFLILLGLAWTRLGALSGRAQSVVFWTALVGAYANWFFPLFSAVVGAGFPPLAGAGFTTQPWQEPIFRFSILLAGVPPVACSALVIWALRGSTVTGQPDDRRHDARAPVP